MTTLEEEISATERAVAGAACALAAFWEDSAAELGLIEEYIPEPVAGSAVDSTAEYTPSPIVRKPTRPRMVRAAPRPPVAQISRTSQAPISPTSATTSPVGDRERLKEVPKK